MALLVQAPKLYPNVAGLLEVSATALKNVREHAGLKGPVLAFPLGRAVATGTGPPRDRVDDPRFLPTVPRR